MNFYENKKEKPDIEKFFGVWSHLSEWEIKNMRRCMKEFRRKVEVSFKKRLSSDESSEQT